MKTRWLNGFSACLPWPPKKGGWSTHFDKIEIELENDDADSSFYTHVLALIRDEVRPDHEVKERTKDLPVLVKTLRQLTIRGERLGFLGSTLFEEFEESNLDIETSDAWLFQPMLDKWPLLQTFRFFGQMNDDEYEVKLDHIADPGYEDRDPYWRLLVRTYDNLERYEEQETEPATSLFLRKWPYPIGEVVLEYDKIVTGTLETIDNMKEFPSRLHFGQVSLLNDGRLHTYTHENLHVLDHEDLESTLRHREHLHDLFLGTTNPVGRLSDKLRRALHLTEDEWDIVTTYNQAMSFAGTEYASQYPMPEHLPEELEDYVGEEKYLPQLEQLRLSVVDWLPAKTVLDLVVDGIPDWENQLKELSLICISKMEDFTEENQKNKDPLTLPTVTAICKACPNLTKLVLFDRSNQILSPENGSGYIQQPMKRLRTLYLKVASATLAVEEVAHMKMACPQLHSLRIDCGDVKVPTHGPQDAKTRVPIWTGEPIVGFTTKGDPLRLGDLSSWKPSTGSSNPSMQERKATQALGTTTMAQEFSSPGSPGSTGKQDSLSEALSTWSRLNSQEKEKFLPQEQTRLTTSKRDDELKRLLDDLAAPLLQDEMALQQAEIRAPHHAKSATRERTQATKFLQQLDKAPVGKTFTVAMPHTGKSGIRALTVTKKAKGDYEWGHVFDPLVREEDRDPCALLAVQTCIQSVQRVLVQRDF